MLNVTAAEHERRQALERGMQPVAEQAGPAEGGAALPTAPGTAPATALAIPPMPAGVAGVHLSTPLLTSQMPRLAFESCRTMGTASQRASETPVAFEQQSDDV
jgi:hypothetical protein